MRARDKMRLRRGREQDLRDAPGSILRGGGRMIIRVIDLVASKENGVDRLQYNCQHVLARIQVEVGRPVEVRPRRGSAICRTCPANNIQSPCQPSPAKSYPYPLINHGRALE
jgi:hypothetical protein